MPPKKQRKTTRRRKAPEHPPRSWYQLRRHKDEPFLTRAHKYLIFIIALSTTLGMGWNALTKADARYAKENAVGRIHDQIIKETKARDDQISKDLALLSQTFEYDAITRAIIFKQEQITKVQDRLKQRLSPQERRDQEALLRSLQIEFDNLRHKQQRLENGQ